jgi:hypothetical protein
MNTIGRAQLETALTALGELLAARELHYEVVLVGGGNLILRDLIARPTTKDLDILGVRTASGIDHLRPMPEPLRDAVIVSAEPSGSRPTGSTPAQTHSSTSACPKGLLSGSSAGTSAAL